MTAKEKRLNNNTNTEDLIEELRKVKTALKMMEARLLQAGKMTTLGQLSAGIAHELKQPLTGIVGFVDEALEEIEKDSPATETLTIVKKEAERMRRIVNGIRKFSRASGALKEPIDVNEIINDSLLLLTKQLANQNIKLETALGERLPKVFANASQIQQVFVNMISNARDAMEPKGGAFMVRSALARGGRHVEVSFTDTGCGMSKDVIKKLSEPFFTTKGPDKGTGLGTSISFSIIKAHKGDINVTSKVGSGTSIKIRLPVAE